MKGRAFAAVVLSVLLLLSGLGIGGWWLLWQRGPLQLAHQPLTMPRAARFVPTSASFSLYLFSDGQRPVDYARAVAPARQRRRAGEAVARLRDGAFAAAGLDYQGELAGWLGGEIAMALFEDPVAAATGQGADQPARGWLLALASRDDDGARRFLQRFWQTRSLAGTDLQVSRYRGMGLISGRGALLGNRPEPLATALVDDDLVLIASGRNLLERALDVSQIPALNQAGQAPLRQGVEAFSRGAALVVASPAALETWLGLPPLPSMTAPETAPPRPAPIRSASSSASSVAVVSGAVETAASGTGAPETGPSEATSLEGAASATAHPQTAAAGAALLDTAGSEENATATATPASPTPAAAGSAATAIGETAVGETPTTETTTSTAANTPTTNALTAAAPTADAAMDPAVGADPIAAIPSRSTADGLGRDAAQDPDALPEGPAAEGVAVLPPLSPGPDPAPVPPPAPGGSAPQGRTEANASPAVRVARSAPRALEAPRGEAPRDGGGAPAVPPAVLPQATSVDAPSAPWLLAVLQPQGRQLELRAHLALPQAPGLAPLAQAPAEALVTALRGRPTSLALVQDPEGLQREPLLRPLLERTLGLRPQGAAEGQGPLPSLLSRTIQGPLLVSQSEEGWLLGSDADQPAAADLAPLVAAQGLLEAPLTVDGHSLQVWTQLSLPAHGGRRDRGGAGADALQASLAGWREQRQSLAWWGQSLVELDVPAEGRLINARRQALRELGVPAAPLQWSLDGDGARGLLRAWQPWRLLSALAGGGLDGPVRGLALAVGSQPEQPGLELKARLQLGE